MFTQKCFIRKNTPEIRKKLEELGYKDYGNLRFYGDPIIIYCEVNHFFTSPFVLEGEQYRGKYDNFIDCSDNEELFLAVAALTDKTDKEQWFIYDSMDCKVEQLRDRFWFKCEEDKVEDHMFYDAMFLNCKKATVKELIEHFNKENE